ncbi:MAG TPA: hypothetical protein VN843_01570 [Anaerolineales bacterium]|nr:hypothetical protein [Anaerolineales bacterium]
MSISPKESVVVLSKSFNTERVDEAEKLIDSKLVDPVDNRNYYHITRTGNPYNQMIEDRYWRFDIKGNFSHEEIVALEKRYKDSGWCKVRTVRIGSEDESTETILYLYEVHGLMV